MVTIKTIAKLCGVSRGTVDRVLHGRGNVKPETEELVHHMAEQLGYTPNPAGKARAARKHRPVVGVLLASEGNPFFDDVIRGIKKAEEMYHIYGLKVIWQTMKGYNVQKQLDLIERLQPRINALIINPINDPRIAQKIDALVAAGILVVTLNNDIENSRRHCYVGSDYVNGGETAGALFKLLMRKSEQVSLGVVQGNSHVLGHCQRLEGFRSRLAALPNVQICAMVENEDDEICSYERTREMLLEHPQINALFIIAGGVYGACRAVLSVKRPQPLTVIAFDSVPSTVEMMKKGVIQAVIYQHPYRQGHKAMDIVFEYLVNGITPRNSVYLLKNEVKLIENL